MPMFDEIASMISGSSRLSELAGMLGAPEASVDTAASAAVPLILGGLQKRTSGTEGAESLALLLDNHRDLDSRTIPTSQLMDDPRGLGSTMIGSIFGSRLDDVEATLAASSGLSSGAISRFLPALAPIVTDHIARRKATGILGRDELAASLAEERVMLENVGFGQWLGLLDGGDVIAEDKDFQSGMAKIVSLGGFGGSTDPATPRTAPAGGVSPTAAATGAAAVGAGAIALGTTGGDASATGSTPRIDIGADTTSADAEFAATHRTTTATTATTRIETASGHDHPYLSDASTISDSRPDPIVDTTKAETKRSGPAWLKWLLPLALIALLGVLLFSCLGGDDDDGTGEVQTPLVDNGSDAGTTDDGAMADGSTDDGAMADGSSDDGAEDDRVTPDPTATRAAEPTPEPEVREEPDESTAPTDTVDEGPQPPVGFTPGRILATAEGFGAFSTLLTAVNAADLATSLDADGPFTVMAPIDSAFDLLPAELRDQVLNDPELIAQVLSYHVINGEFSTNDAETGPVQALDGSQLYIDNSGFQPRINGATVLDADIEADNGVIQVIDRVLIPPTLIGATGLSVNEALSLPSITFEPGSAALASGASDVLDSMVPYLSSSDFAVEIGGHTDADGSDEANLALSEQRAATVLGYLTDTGGIDPARLTAVGYGEAQPVGDNDTPEGKAANRRIEFTVQNG